MPKDPYKYFRPEAHELVERLGKGVLDLESHSASPDRVLHLLRLAHTLKGAARVVKQQEVAERAHAIEEALSPFREPKDGVPSERINGVLHLIDEIRDRLSRLAPAVPSGQTAPDDGLHTIRAGVTEIDALLESVTESHAHLTSLRAAARSVDRVRDLTDVLAKQLTAPGPREAASPAAVSVRSARGLADELRRLVTGLERQIDSSLDQLDRELGQVRQSAEQLRLAPAGTLFTQLERTVRDAAQALNKRVRFDGTGGDVRVEAHVLAVVQRALVQMIRNAVAHGIELPAARSALGKPPTGLVKIGVTRRGQHVVFRVQDDGRGIDLEAVRAVAAQRGLLDPETRELGAKELIRLLLRGGITTSASVTDVAGRGIGLDVVREVSESLRGQVTVLTEAAKGAVFELAVPVSLASLEALVVETRGVLATIPLDGVRQMVRVAPAGISSSGEGESVVHEGQAVPFISLSRALRMPTAARPAGVARSTVIVHGTSGTAAIEIDRCVGTARIVARPLPRFSVAERVIAGAYLDAEGNPQLVLDPDALVLAAARQDTVDHPSEPVSPPQVLVVDDSLTTRMLEQSILEAAGYEVDAVTSAEEALLTARRKSYQLFLVDVEMPGMDGFAFIEHARSDPALRPVPAILVTSRASAEDRQRGQQVGAQGYIVKSDFDQAQLLARIKQLVQ